jgi:hypothetical protein
MGSSGLDARTRTLGVFLVSGALAGSGLGLLPRERRPTGRLVRKGRHLAGAAMSVLGGPRRRPPGWTTSR